MGERKRVVIILIIAAVVLCAVFVVGGILLTSGSEKTRNLVISYDSLTLRESGMRGSVEYELVCEGKRGRITEYQIIYSGEKEQKEILAQTVIDNESVLEQLNTCQLLSWNGFKGAHPKNVTDGTMFTFEAVLNGIEIRAEGSQNFPKHYHDFTAWLQSVLQDAEQSAD